MAQFNLKNTAQADAVTPDAGYIAIFSDSADSIPKYKDSSNVVHTFPTSSLSSATPLPVGTTGDPGTGSTGSKNDHVHAHGAQTDPTLHAAATTATAGFTTYASDAETITGTETAKTVTPSNITAKIDTDGTLAGDLDTRIPSQKAVKTYADTKIPLTQKAAASGVASLDAGSLVVQNPANATATPTASKIVIADAGGLVNGWVSPATTSVAGLMPATDRLYLSQHIVSTSLTAAVVSSGTTEKVLLQMLVPANAAKVGDAFKIRLIGNSSSTGTLIFRVRVGAAGTITDTQTWISTTSAMQAANARAGVDLVLTVRSTGIGTVYTDGNAHAGAAMLPTLIGAPATASVTTTANWYINVDVTCSSGTFSAQAGVIEALQ
jgi:hypothetical protein